MQAMKPARSWNYYLQLSGAFPFSQPRFFPLNTLLSVLMSSILVSISGVWSIYCIVCWTIAVTACLSWPRRFNKRTIWSLRVFHALASKHGWRISVMLMPHVPGVPRCCQMDGCVTSTFKGSWFSRYTCKRHPDRVSGRTLRWCC